ncbi:hypothetical protein [Streptomyces bullii]|uniref:Uncharacterized protein n=1 Tax=Streptomyces bullii TaxID=349910 RepID=A0ABW0UJ32_9ACTN
MGLTSGSRATIVAAAAATLGGLPVLIYGIWSNDTARSLGGACLIMSGLVLVALVLIRRWIVDTSEERRALAAALRDAQAEKARYFAAQAALENEQGRLNRDMNVERMRIAKQLLTEREAMRVEFEEQRAALIAETMEAAFLMMRNRKSPSEPPAQCNLIQFPEKLPAQERSAAPERERSRGHGVVGP